MQFTKATRKKAKLRLALSGPSGSGKTYSALLLAKGIGARTAVIDTERDSASLYSDIMEFDSLNLSAPYSPERYIQAIRAAEQAGYETLVIDSLSHEWSGVGGCLELVDEIAKAKFRGNSWSAWNEVTPRHRALLDAILQSPMHIIATTRAKTETAQTEENGRKKVVKLGMKAEQRDGLEYEFTIALDLVHDGNYATASKDRTGLFSRRDPQPVTEDTSPELLAWLDSGASAPDLRAIIENIAKSATSEVLRTNYEAAMQMLPEEHHAGVKAAKNRRYRELVPKEEAT
jgi:hypothetical protein